MITTPKLVPLAGVSVISLTNKERLYQRLLKKSVASKSHSFWSDSHENAGLVESIQETVYSKGDN